MPTLLKSLRSPVAFALPLLFAFAGSVFFGGAASGAGAESRLVAEVTRTGRDGHPYNWAPPSC